MTYETCNDTILGEIMIDRTLLVYVCILVDLEAGSYDHWVFAVSYTCTILTVLNIKKKISRYFGNS